MKILILILAGVLLWTPAATAQTLKECQPALKASAEFRKAMQAAREEFERAMAEVKRTFEPPHDNPYGTYSRGLQKAKEDAFKASKVAEASNSDDRELARAKSQIKAKFREFKSRTNKAMKKARRENQIALAQAMAGSKAAHDRKVLAAKDAFQKKVDASYVGRRSDNARVMLNRLRQFVVNCRALALKGKKIKL